MGTNCSGGGVAEAPSVHDNKKSANTRNVAVDHSKDVILLEGRNSNTFIYATGSYKICDVGHNSHRVNFDGRILRLVRRKNGIRSSGYLCLARTMLSATTCPLAISIAY